MNDTLSVIQINSVVRRSIEPISAEVGDDLVILSLQRGHYYATHMVGKRIWALIAESIHVEQICDIMMQEFDVERPVCEREVLAFLTQMKDEGLLQIL